MLKAGREKQSAFRSIVIEGPKRGRGCGRRWACDIRGRVPLQKPARKPQATKGPNRVLHVPCAPTCPSCSFPGTNPTSCLLQVSGTRLLFSPPFHLSTHRAATGSSLGREESCFPCTLCLTGPTYVQLQPPGACCWRSAPNPGSEGTAFGRQSSCGKNTAQGIGRPRLVAVCTQEPCVGLRAGLSYICFLLSVWHGALHRAGCQQLFAGWNECITALLCLSVWTDQNCLHRRTWVVVAAGCTAEDA